MKINNIKVMAATIALVSCGYSFSICKDRLNYYECESSEEYVVITETTTEEVIPTTQDMTIEEETSTYITVDVTETTVNPYNDIMFLYDLDNSVSLEDLSFFIYRYSSYSKYSYDEAISILYNNINSFDSYDTLEGYIMCTLFDSAGDDNLLSSTCSSSLVENEDLSLVQKESYMIDMCDALGLSNTDKTIVLAVFRHETGNGSSKRCCYDNNYGGIKVSDSFGVYQTPYYGMYKAIMCIDGHINRNKEKLGTTDMYSIVSGMSYSYCPGTASDWTNKIISFCNDVSCDYNDFSDSYEYKIS